MLALASPRAGEAQRSGDTARRAIARAGHQAISSALTAVRAARRLTDDEVAWLAALAVSAPVRDIAIRHLTRSRADADASQSLWLDVLRRCGDAQLTGAACLFALAAWRGGDTTLARFALERVLRLDPGCQLALDISCALGHGLSPSAVEAFLRQPRLRPGRGQGGRRRSSSGRAGSPRV
jgi:hypothetical protein